MSIPAGWAEFNDATAVIRGRMVAASGTFSGTFAADVIDAVDTINIRNGAVSAYYGFGFAAGSQDATFTIPAQPHASVVDIIAPIMVESFGKSAYRTNMEGRAEVYRDGVLVARDIVYIPTDTEMATHEGGNTYIMDYMPAMQVVRYIDLDVKPYASTQYVIRLYNGGVYQEVFKYPSNYGTYEAWDASGFTRVGLLGSITVGCRKR